MENIPPELEKIAPLWHRRIVAAVANGGPLDQPEKINGKWLHIMSCSQCVIGEMHGFSDKYIEEGTKDHCEQCAFLASKLYRTVDNDDESAFTSALRESVDHWNAKHT